MVVKFSGKPIGSSVEIVDVEIFPKNEELACEVEKVDTGSGFWKGMLLIKDIY